MYTPNFGPFLIQRKVEPSLYDMLCEDIRNVVVKEHIDHRQSLAGKIDNEYGFNPELLQKYRHSLMPYVSEYLSRLAYDWNRVGNDTLIEDQLREIERDMHLTGMWANFQQKNEYNPLHNHIGDISFVLYIDVPEIIYEEESIATSHPNGTITFTHELYPPTLYDIEKETAQYRLKDLLHPITAFGPLRPTNGDLLMFPSYLNHHVEAFKSDVTRVSVAGNLTMIPQN